jgi:assimilatory nitrate reductase catalytic subunit
MRRGDVFVPMHWGSRFTSGTGTNALTLPALDPHSKQPELKHAAVKVERYTAQWQGLWMRAAAATSPADDTARLQLQIAPLLPGFDYGAITLADGDCQVVSVELATSAPPAAEVVAALDDLFGLPKDDGLLIYDDSVRGVERRARIDGNALIALRLTGELAGAQRLRQAILSRSDVSALRRHLLAPVAELAGLPQGRGRMVCSCLNVSENEIRTAIAAGSSLSQLQSALKCGTQCGSCVPELRNLLAGNRTQALAA